MSSRKNTDDIPSKQEIWEKSDFWRFLWNSSLSISLIKFATYFFKYKTSVIDLFPAFDMMLNLTVIKNTLTRLNEWVLFWLFCSIHFIFVSEIQNSFSGWTNDVYWNWSLTCYQWLAPYLLRRLLSPAFPVAISSSLADI